MTKKKSVEKSNPECRRSLTDRSELQKFVLHLLQGTMIGIGAVLPGISGGVLSVVFGIYEPIMAFLSNPGRRFHNTADFCFRCSWGQRADFCSLRVRSDFS